MSGTTLAVDYGTSNTVALLRWPDQRIRPLLFDGSPLLPSAVHLEPDGTVRAGPEAVRAARVRPECYEPTPKRRIDEGTLLLGEREISIAAAIAATLRVVWDEATRTAGAPPGSVVLTFPVSWGAVRRAVLVDAAVRAGLPAPALVPEPVAAAAYHVRAQGGRIPDGQSIVVYDLGAGTFDVSVVSSAFETLAYDGLDDLGGVDLDALVVAATGVSFDPGSRAFRQLWDDARAAKESLSRRSSAEVLIPSLDRDVRVTREGFEAAARPLLERSVDVTAAAIDASPGRVAGLFLVGGSTRVPLVATLLHRRLGIVPTVLDHPEIVVAEGALHTVPAEPAAVAEVKPPGVTIASRPWLIALRGLAVMLAGGSTVLFALFGLAATLFVLGERHQLLPDTGSLVLFGVVLVAGAGVFGFGSQVTARAFDRAQLGFEPDRLVVRSTARIGHALVRIGGRLLIGAAFAAAGLEVVLYDARNATAWAVLVGCVAGFVGSLVSAVAQFRHRPVRIDATGSSTADAELAWADLAVAEIRPVGWRRSRTLFVSLAPGVARPSALRPVRGSEALRVLDLGAYAMPVGRVEKAVGHYWRSVRDETAPTAAR
ncbi:Hsp70 family protein [Cryptosporangium arvum]|uniref:Molecular chaperone n=1 Tax=Cryptosporangium arvum DSM 44712 TaxID=927661 RepID=A0A010ZTV2_9ACTN|nr:Hsp70 family protein [Cryptosporangium arvum]EXG80642.1 molecular chaperone [Cryptosporangium arvum DSM 44712]